MIYQNISESIGNTPLIDLTRFSPSSQIKIYAKLEGVNPGGSIKDRIAYQMIKKAEESRLLTPGKILIEATSGNTGIGMAMIAAERGYRFIAVMSESASLERRKLIRGFGAEVVLTDRTRGTNGAIQKAQEMVSRNLNLIMLDQFKNEENVLAHYQTTGKELIRELNKVDYFVAGIGTGGTLVGTGKRLREKWPEVKIVAIEPSRGEKVDGLHQMEKDLRPILDPAFIDQKLNVSRKESLDWTRKLIRSGISVGISSGAAMWGVIRIASNIKSGSIVTIFPDRADRYLSTDLFR